MKAFDVTFFAGLGVAVVLCSVWLCAGLAVDGLGTARTAWELRRKARQLSTLMVFGVVAPVAGLVVPGEVAAAAALPTAVPALVVLLVSVRRVGHVRRGADVIGTTARTPVPPALRAAAAHPLVVVPVQLTALASLLGLPIAGRLVSVPGAGLAGIAITVVALAVAVIGVRAAVRHSRLAARRAVVPPPAENNVVSARS